MCRRKNILAISTDIGIFLATFWLPLKTSLSNFGIILTLFTTALSFFFFGFLSKRFSFGLLGLTSILYVPIMIGSFYTDYPENKYQQLVKMLFYLLTPLLLFRKDLSSSRLIKIAAFGLILGSLISSLILISINTYEFLRFGQGFKDLLSYQFTGRLFVAPLREMHPVYLGSYFVFSLILLFEFQWRLTLFIRISIISIILTAVFFINSRIIFLLVLVACLSSVFRLLSKKGFVLLVFTLVAFSFVVFPKIKDTYVYQKATKSTAWDLKNNVSTFNTDMDKAADSRMSRWIISWELFTKNPILGHGTGSSRELLMEKYRENSMTASLQQKYDSHNQVLGFAIDYGILGILVFMTFFASNFFQAFQQQSYVYAIFVFMTFVICITENYLIRNMGINFVAIWVTLFQIKKDNV